VCPTGIKLKAAKRRPKSSYKEEVEQSIAVQQAKKGRKKSNYKPDPG